MLLESAKLLRSGSQNTLDRVLSTLANSTRDTDIKGWYQEHFTIGVIFTELGSQADGKSVASALLSKVTTALSSTLTINEINEIRIWLRVFPEDWDGKGGIDHIESKFYDELFHEHRPDPLSKLLKRSMDVAGSLLALVLGLPVFLFSAIAIKLTSPGPILFRQERLGQYGRKFSFLKFRSMYVACDESVHREYVRRFIADAPACDQSKGVQPLYKLTNDPRITRVGRFLRKTSLWMNCRSFLNVLKGEMSLVGPRPPLLYEVECYHVWHKARLLATKPSITGLWQVGGRSRVKFDDMVRMDLKYADSWSFWLDIKILLQTPRAVLSGSGAH